jgi:hypothetical protein
MALDPSPNPAGNVVLVAGLAVVLGPERAAQVRAKGETLFMPHAATCPALQEQRRDAAAARETPFGGAPARIPDRTALKAVAGEDADHIELLALEFADLVRRRAGADRDLRQVANRQWKAWREIPRTLRKGADPAKVYALVIARVSSILVLNLPTTKGTTAA